MPDPVYIDILPIPDGRAPDGKLRLCIQLSPSDRVHTGGQVALPDWPAAVAARLGTMRIWRADLANGQWSGSPTVVATVPADTVALLGDGAAATLRWKRLFEPPGFEVLRTAISEAANSAAGPDGLIGSATRFIANARTADLAVLLDSVYADLLRGSANARTRGASLAAFAAPSRMDGSRLLDTTWEILAGALDLENHARFARNALAADMARLRTAGLASMPDPFAERAREIDLVPKTLGNLMATQFAATSSPMSSLMGEFALALAVDEGPDPMSPEPADPIPEAIDTAKRKLAGLMSFPSLARSFGLCADLLFDRTALAQGTGAIGVDFGSGSPDPKTIAWTAYSHGEADGRLYFLPWDRQRAPSADAPYVNGLLNLNQVVADQPRYRLSSAEVAGTVMQLAATAKRIVEQKQAGRRSDGNNAPIVDRTTMGIVLHDHFAGAKEKTIFARDVMLLQSTESEPVVNFAEDLHQGVRFDVLLEPAASARADDRLLRWRPLMARKITFDQPDADLAGGQSGLPANREDAIAQTPVGEPTSRPHTNSVVTDEIMKWGGGSLAVASAAQPQTPVPANDLAFEMRFDLHKRADNPLLCPPPLRFGRGYRVRARVAFPMGCGLSFGDTPPATTGSHVFPNGAEPFVYRRLEPVGAPELLLPWDSELVTAVDSDHEDGMARVERSLRVFGGRTLDELVVVTGDRDRQSDSRYLMPARLPLDQAEQQGQLDDRANFNARFPPGAFEGRVRVALYGTEGKLPEARGGAITWLAAPNVFEAELPSRLRHGELVNMGPRGAVLVLDPRAAQRQQQRYQDAGNWSATRYYPDRFARVVVGRFSAVKNFPAPPQDDRNAVHRAEFWQRRDKPNDAMPIMIELQRGPDRPAAPARWLKGSSDIEIRPPNSPQSLRLRKLTVELGPAQTVEVELFPECREPEFARMHHAGAILAAEHSAAELDTIHSRPLRQVNYSRKVKLVHAVQRPLGPPALSGTAGAVGLGLHAATLTVRPEDSVNDGRLTWSNHVDQGDPYGGRIESEEGGANTFFVGRIGVHGRSTGRLRCDARWKDYGPASLKRAAGTGRWTLEAPHDHARLFEIEGIASPETSHAVDLVTGSDGALRALSYAFKDGRARRLNVRAVATSRFTDYFPSEEGESRDLERLGMFERASSAFAAAPDLWIKCTFRTPPPVIDRVIPVFDWKRRRTGRAITFERRSFLRVFLDAPWYVSGEGEKLALVFDAAQRQTCDYEAPELEAFARYVTRWGRDPIRMTEPVAPLTTYNMSDRAPVRGLLLPAGDPDSSNRAAQLAVDILPFSPVFDPELGLYCDIPIGPLKADRERGAFLPSHSSFVQLGLARYQEHAVPGLQLSRPKDYLAHLLPDRLGRLEVTGFRSIRLTIKGPVFAYAEPQDESGRLRDLGPRLTATLLVRREIEIMGRPSGDFVWDLALDDHRRPVVRTDQAPTQRTPGDPMWDLTINLPNPYEEEHYGLLVEEYEYLPADPPDLDQNAPLDQLAGRVRSRRGPLFSEIVDIGQ